ncbi:unnamed protein product [Rotaria sp. Silwood1]|nr:unnamed protein product [Rotaria sp. Silwood1]CAF1515755.1 unnamed protein product [Rotaria sp. Silwood1]CAF1519943.1 unnamed protein product [Rotaria sp. Silwood1]CAF3510949.1 unnamed protein product [Rotaria sp. Silwood1]CAF3643978.1 unnamed protein product [Rotaria sp. Silwood1]
MAIANGSNNIVVFQSGTYNFTSVISIECAVNLTIMGQGMQQTLLLGNSPSAMFKPFHCQGLTITSLAIDFDPLPFTAGYVVSANTSYLDVQVVPPHKADIGRQVHAILQYDPVEMRPAFSPNAYEIYQTPPSNANTSLVSPGILRIPLASPSIFVAGDPIVARYTFARHAIDAQDVTDFTVQSIIIYTAWCMGVVTLRAKRLNIIDYHVIPRDGRWMSASVDCMHFADSRDYINIVDSKCEAQGDDGLNVHGFYFTVAQIINSTALIFEEFNWFDVLNVGVGTHLEFSSSQRQFTVYATATVASSSIYGPTSRLFTFTSPINASVGDWASVADTPTLTIRNLTVANNRARGVLLKTRNIQITDSLFNRTSGPAVLFEPSMYWYESVAAQNVTLSRNVYISCNQGIAKQKGVISFAPLPRQLVPVFSDVIVESSTFLFGVYGQGLIQGNNAANVSISGNYIAINSSISLISICNSQNISAHNNTLVNHQFTVDPFYYDNANPCQTNFSRLIDLPLSGFNSSFPPPVTVTNLGVQVNVHEAVPNACNVVNLSKNISNSCSLSNIIG